MHILDTRITKQLVCILAIVAAACIYGQTDTAYVVPPDTPSHTPAYPYNTWETAATSIQPAVNAALAENYAKVLVATGIYEMTTGPVTIEGALTLQSDNNGKEDPENTIIDGLGLYRCLIINHADAVCAGFTITNGYSAALYTYGGGVDISQGTLSNCLVTGCSTARYGGGISASAGASILDCSIIGNQTGTNGGGIYAINDTTIARCLIKENKLSGSGSGSGIYLQPGTDGQCLVSDCQIIYNESGSCALYLIRGKSSVISNIVCSFNSSRGIYIFGGDPNAPNLIIDSIIQANDTNDGDDGNGGGILLTPDGTACYNEFRNCLITDNTAFGQGGGVYYNNAASRYTSFVNCTIIGNKAGSYGGGMYARGAIVNTIIYGNTVISGTSSNVTLAGGTSSFQYSCIGLADPPDGDGNINIDPMFVLPAERDYRLQMNSPCIDTAKKYTWMTEASDLDGRQRLDRFSRKPDMGCYEYVPPGMMFWLR